jgi:hypothetical protein
MWQLGTPFSFTVLYAFGQKEQMIQRFKKTNGERYGID